MRGAGIVVAFAAVFPAAVRAQAPQNYESEMVSGMVSLRDARTGRTLISPSYQPVANGSDLTPEVRLTPKEDGFDVTVSYTNSGSKPAPMGSISLPGIRLGRAVSYLDFKSGVEAQSAVQGSGEFRSEELLYPAQIYSPVFALADESAVLGISLNYPVVQYDQPVAISLRSPVGAHAATGRNWEVDFRLVGDLPAGQKREYTLCVRAAPRPDLWLRTLQPYRDAFRARSGPMQYKRDARPVAAVAVADPFAVPAPGSPDPTGLASAARIAKDRLARGFSRVVMLTPTGSYTVHADLNPPFQFMTRVSAAPTMRSSLTALRSIAAPGRAAGYWWGHSTTVMDGWDTGVSHPLDPASKADAAAAFAELDAATSVNASIVVLDGFERLSPAQGAAWLAQLRARAPHVSFVTSMSGNSAGTADIYHTMAPGLAQDPRAENFLADLVNPGHETWAMPPAGASIDWAAKAAEMGYVPVISGDSGILGRNLNAAASWRNTLPIELQPPEDPAESASEPESAQAPAEPEPQPRPAAAEVDHSRQPRLRFSAPTFQRNTVDAALDRARISVFSKPRHKPLPTEAKDERADVPEAPR